MLFQRNRDPSTGQQFKFFNTFLGKDDYAFSLQDRVARAKMRIGDRRENHFRVRDLLSEICDLFQETVKITNPFPRFALPPLLTKGLAVTVTPG